MLEALRTSTFEGDLPEDPLYHPPEWCVYVPLPADGRWTWGVQGELVLSGFFAHLEYDVNHKTNELRLLLEVANGPLLPVPIHLGKGSLAEAIGSSLERAIDNLQNSSIGLQSGVVERILGSLGSVTRGAEPLVSVLLYLCTQAAEIIGPKGTRPTFPKPVKTKKGERLFPPDAPTPWDVGCRVGAALRSARAEEGLDLDGTHAGPRPHMRRAHWHTYRVGPRSTEQRRVVKWLPPIAVATNKGDIVPTVRKVEPPTGNP